MPAEHTTLRRFSQGEEEVWHQAADLAEGPSLAEELQMPEGHQLAVEATRAQVAVL